MGKFGRKFDGRIKLGEVRALSGAVEAIFYRGLAMLVAKCKIELPVMRIVKLADCSGFGAPREYNFNLTPGLAAETRIALRCGHRIGGEVIRF